MDKIVAQLLCCLVIVVMIPRPASAECIGPASPCESWADAKAVWLGTVEKSEVGESDRQIGPITYLVTMVVDEVFFGRVETGKRIHFEEFRLGEGGVVPKLGERYLVYAANADGTRFSLNMCSGSKRLEWAEKDLEYARALGGKAPVGSLRGVVGAISRPSPGSARLEGAQIVIEGSAGRLEAMTDRDGAFVFRDAAPGAYRLSALYPGYQASWRRAPIVEIPATGCAYREIVMAPTNELSGHVFDHLGESLGGVVLQVIPLPPLRSGDVVNGLATTKPNGQFQFSGLQAGQYRLGVNLSRGPDSDQPFPATFFPGTTDWRQAAVLTLGDATKFTSLDFALGPALQTYTLQGRVLYPDGSPAVKVRVGAFDPRFHDQDYRHYSDVEWTDEAGEFSLAIYKGIDYRLEASVYPRGGGSHCSPIEDLPAEHSDHSATRVLVLTKTEPACKPQRDAQLAGPHAKFQ